MVRNKGIYTLGGEMINSQLPTITTGPATFENAISATGFGKFNYLLLLISLPANWACMISLFNAAFIIPALQCDFNLNMMEIGIINASPFIGNIPGAFLWGYLADTMGRKKLMIYSMLADAICNIFCAFSVNMWMVATLKFVSGFIIQGPGAIIMSYLSECFSNKHRSKIILISGIFMGFVNLGLPLLAWSILPANFYYIRPWQLFLLLCTIPSIITGFSFIILPESPKFLMMQGKHDEALDVFQNIYSMNSGKPKNEYPIDKLLCENYSSKNTEKIREEISGWKQVKPLFLPPYLWKLILTLLMQFFILLGANTLKTWLPELFSLMDEFTSNNNQTANLCDIITDHLQESQINNTNYEGPCIASQTNDKVYMNLCIVGIFSVSIFCIVTTFISVVNKKILLGTLLTIAGCCGIALIWCTDPVAILIISALYSTITGVSCVTFISITVDLFPTSFRTLTVSLSLTTGRIGSIIGNLVFPALLAVGCFPPFFFLGGSILACIIPLVLLSSAKIEDL